MGLASTEVAYHDEAEFKIKQNKKRAKNLRKKTEKSKD